MAEQHPRGVPCEAADGTDEKLWEALGRVPRESPPRSLRRNFYRRLREREQRPPLPERIAGWLRPAAPAAATLLLGLLLGLHWPQQQGRSGPELEALRTQVTRLNQTVALALLRDDSASERLRGVTIAANLSGDDGRLTRALLDTARRDPVSSVRNAAIDALGPQLADPEIGAEILRLLRDTESVLVQAALAELIMTWGDETKLQELVDAAAAGALQPEVATIVMSRIRRNEI